MTDIHLFSAHLKPSISSPPVDLLCQALDLHGEKLLWVDGIQSDSTDPAASAILVPISATKALAYRGTLGEFMKEHQACAEQVLLASRGRHSATIMARAILYMSRDPSLSADEALDLVLEEAMHLIECDSLDRGALAAVKH